MMEHAHEQQQKDFLSSFFSAEHPMDHLQAEPEGQHHQSMFQFSGPSAPAQSTLGIQPSHQQSAMNSQFNMELLGNFMQMQGIEPPLPSGSMSSPTMAPYNPQLLLEQQFKLTQLQQLQQLQNQIFQQQIALISSQTSGIPPDIPSNESQRERSAPFHGLPTPGSSTELRPQHHPLEFVSPMILNNYMDPSPHSSGSMTNHTMNSHYGPPRGSTSAPEHIAFRTSPSFPPPSPADLDFDISPLTSPWLGAQHQQTTHAPTNNKRNATSSGDEGNARKKHSPAIRPTHPTLQTQGPASKKIYRGSKSTSSTPLLRSTRSRKGSVAGEVVGDTPSPVDLSMPPPAPPSNPLSSQSSSPTSPRGDQIPLSPHVDAQLTPVTPASIMNLGRLGLSSSLAPPRQGKSPTKTKPPAEQPSRNKPAPKKIPGSLVSPSLKAILPAASSVVQNATTSPVHPVPVVQVRKTSHKAAEQKRRDSLKTTFDDLRGLLPPIPLPSDEKHPDEPVLPGALPPRGPPKAGGEGPNKAVSKLQLLMCGNDYIRQLKGRVDRRSEEIVILRREVVRLRNIIGPGAEDGAEDGLDLVKDLDAMELGSIPLGRSGVGGFGGLGYVGEEEGDDDADADA